MSESIALRIKSNRRHLNCKIIDRKIKFETKKNELNNKKPHNKCQKTESKISQECYKSLLTFDELNDDVLTEILRRLPLVDRIRSQVVCKRWHQLVCHLLTKQTAVGLKNIAYDRSDCSFSLRHLVTDNDLIDKVFFPIKSTDLNDNEFDFRLITQRDQNECLENLRAILSKCPKILSLDLHRIEFNESLVQLIVDLCPKLECLHLNSMVIADNAWTLMTRRLSKRLLHLTIRNSIQMSQKCFVREFVQSCDRLKCIKVTEWNHKLHFRWFDYISDTVDEIQIACTSAKHIFNLDDTTTKGIIRRLNLSTFEALSQSVIDYIGNHFLNLTQIDLRNCEGFNKRSFRSLANLPELEQLSMDLAYANCDEDFALLAQNCTKMRRISLNFGFISLASLQMIGKSWSGLESASFRFVHVDRLNADALDVFISWKQLRRLSLHGTNISDQICRVIQNCDSLRYLNLDFCNAVSRKVVNSMIICAKQRPNQSFELSIKETKINKFSNFDVNVVANNVIRVNNVFIHYTPDEI